MEIESTNVSYYIAALNEQNKVAVEEITSFYDILFTKLHGHEQ